MRIAAVVPESRGTETVVAVLGHRGAPTLARENTIAAFVAAARLGADGVELDVRRTADGALVVHHDPAIAGVGAIAQLTVHDLPEDVPLLDAALDACFGLVVNVEIKNSPIEPDYDPAEHAAAEVAALIAERRRPDRQADQVVVSAFTLPTIDVVKTTDPTLATGWITLSSLDQDWALVTAVERGHDAIHPQEQAVTKELVERAQAEGIAVRAWTVDDPGRIRELDEFGVDALITNDVALALSILRPQVTTER
jgi:glycerophosphoryl diester phosphodiesterase